MPLYDVRCPQHGVHEVFRRMNDEDFRCEAAADCAAPVERVFLEAPGMSVSAEGEASSHPQRMRDGTAGFNLGLRGVDTVVGTRPDGKPRLKYRPVSHNELPTRRARVDAAKRQGLIPDGQTVKRAVGAR